MLPLAEQSVDAQSCYLQLKKQYFFAKSMRGVGDAAANSREENSESSLTDDRSEGGAQSSADGATQFGNDVDATDSAGANDSGGSLRVGATDAAAATHSEFCQVRFVFM